VTSRSRPSLVVIPKALAMAPLSVVASPLAILSLPPSRVRPLAPYCPISWHLTAKPPRLAPYCCSRAGTLLLLTGWHPTAAHGLAPYCCSPAGTLLLLTGWHPTAAHRLAPYCCSPAGTLLLLTGWHPTAAHRLAPYCSSSLAGIPSARWLRSPTYLSASCDLLCGHKPRLGYG